MASSGTHQHQPSASVNHSVVRLPVHKQFHPWDCVFAVPWGFQEPRLCDLHLAHVVLLEDDLVCVVLQLKLRVELTALVSGFLTHGLSKHDEYPLQGCSFNIILKIL